MKHNCLEHLQEFTVDTLYPHGNIESDTIFQCLICGKEFDPNDLINFYKGIDK